MTLPPKTGPVIMLENTPLTASSHLISNQQVVRYRLTRDNSRIARLPSFCDIHGHAGAIDLTRTLRQHIYFTKIPFPVHYLRLIFAERSAGDVMVRFGIDRRNLSLIFALEAFKRRPSITSKWIRDKEQKLGHKIKPYEYCKYNVIETK